MDVQVCVFVHVIHVVHVQGLPVMKAMRDLVLLEGRDKVDRVHDRINVNNGEGGRLV